MDFTTRYRELRSAGYARDDALGELRREGASFITCMKAAHDVDGLSLAECKLAVHQSPAWSDVRQTRETFWDEMIRQLEKETQE